MCIRLLMALAQVKGQPPRVPNPDSHYRLGPDSLPQEGVPKDEVDRGFRQAAARKNESGSQTGCIQNAVDINIRIFYL